MHNLFWSLLILVLIAAFMRMNWVYYLAYVVGGVWLFSHWWIRRSLGHLAVERDMLDHAFVGEKIPITLRFQNRSWLPLPWLQLEERVPLDLKDVDHYNFVLSVGGRSQATHHYDLMCKRRGYYHVGPLLLRTGDLFGFVDGSWQESESRTVIVYPQVFALHKLGLPSRSPFGTVATRQRLFEDPNRVAGVREYVSGDSLRRIHWKASAHEDTLLVKKFQPAIALNVSIILDLNRNAYPYNAAVGSSEWAITVAASIASYIIGQRQPVGLQTNGHDSLSEQTAAPIPPHNGQGHLMNVLSLLARIQLHDFEPTLAQWLPRRVAHLEWGTTLIVVTPLLDEQALWALHQAYRRGSNINVLICAQHPGFDALRARGERLNIKIHRTIWEKDLKSMSQMG